MGDMAEHLEEWFVEEEARFDYHEESYQPASTQTENHHPKTDAEAKRIIEHLNHYEWDTHQVRGRFDRNPYRITATINEQRHCIHLPGRFGGVLKWLDQKERQLAHAS